MSWPLVKLGELITEDRSGASLKKDEFTDTGIAVVPKKAISESVDLLTDTFVFTSSEKFSSCKSATVNNEYLITTLRNLNPDGSTLGLICRHDFREDIMLAQGMYGFKVSEKVDSNYLCYASRRPEFRAAIQRVKVGSTQVHIRARELKETEIPLPPLAEQKRIAAILDKADAIRRKRQQAIQLADEFLRSVFLDMFGDPVTNPKGLNVVPLLNLCNKVTDGTHQSPKWEDSGVPFLFISNIVDGKINYETSKFISRSTYEELTRSTPIEKGDILYTTVGSYGNVALVPGDKDFCFQRHIAHIKPNPKVVNPYFLAGMLSSSAIRRQADRMVRGVAQKTLNLRELKEIKVFDLAKADQQRYIDVTWPVHNMLENFNYSLKKLDDAFHAISQQVFSGKI